MAEGQILTVLLTPAEVAASILALVNIYMGK